LDATTHLRSSFWGDFELLLLTFDRTSDAVCARECFITF
jgi:hypothetical protein